MKRSITTAAALPGALSASLWGRTLSPVFVRYAGTVGFLVVVLLAALLLRKMMAIDRECLRLLEKSRHDRMVIAAQREKLRVWQQYVDQANIQIHEVRSHALVMEAHLRQGALGKVEVMLSEMSRRVASAGRVYTRNVLLDTLLGWGEDTARARGIRVQYVIEGISAVIPMDDHDLAGIVINLLENAIEANAAADPAMGYIVFSIKLYRGTMIIECTNPVHTRRKGLGKSNPERHGYGLRIVRGIAARYHGGISISRGDGLYSVAITLALATSCPGGIEE